MGAAIHVRGASRERFLALIVARLGTEGFEMTEANENENVDGVRSREANAVSVDEGERPTRRLIVNRSGRWLAMSERGMDLEGWATYLSRALETSVLCIFSTPLGLPNLAQVTRFDHGRQIENVEIPRDMTRDKNERILLPCGVLEPWLSPGSRPARMKHLVFTSEQRGAADILEAIGEAIDLPRLWIDADEADSEAGDLELDFAPRAR
ncbi:MAG: hypothetical protein H6729_13815 [Deltaproteobacteria bacterium]|nr:hypothetical protein [Deltaproteobacteria bacterium]